MEDNRKKTDAWQTITLLIVVLALFGGLYVSNQAIDSRLNSLEQSIAGSEEMLKMVIERVEDKVEAVQVAVSGEDDAVAAKAAASAADPAKPADSKDKK